MTSAASPLLGDVIYHSHGRDPFAKAIQAAQWYAWKRRKKDYGDGRWKIHHWQLVTQVHSLTEVTILEATFRRGIIEHRITLDGHFDAVSPAYTDAAAGVAAALAQWKGKRYGVLMILALLFYILGFEFGWVERLCKSTDTAVCSEVGAYAAQLGGDKYVTDWFWWIPADVFFL